MEASSVPSYKYDVGISFLTRDLPVAQQLYDTLSPNLKVLLYTERQDVLAAVDGLSAFRTAFKSECQVVVVLYRKEWGETPWTAVEQQAIKDRLLNAGGHWRWLVFVMLNVADPVPDWMHDTYIKYDYERYGPEQLAGLVKGRAEELGIVLRAETGVEMATRALGRSQAQEKRQILLANSAHAASLRLFEEFRQEFFRQGRDMPAFDALKFGLAPGGSACIATNGTWSLRAALQPHSVQEEGSRPVRISTWQGQLQLEGDRLIYLWTPEQLNEVSFGLDVDPPDSWFWVSREGTPCRLTSAQLADHAWKLFWKLTERPDPPHFIEQF